MMEFLKNWVLNIVILSVFVVLLEMLVPSGKTKKFVNLVTGFILLIALINPFLHLYKNGIDISKVEATDSNYIDKYQIEHDSSILKKGQMKQVTGVYKKKLGEDIKQNLSSIKNTNVTNVDIEIDDNYSDKNYGNINKVKIQIKKENTPENTSSVKKVEKVEIGVSGAKAGNKEEVDEETVSKIKNEVVNFLGVDKDIIAVTYDE